MLEEVKVMECKDCFYFRQHYVKRDNIFLEAGCGHCKYPRLKSRRPETPACGNFKPKETEEDAQ